MNYFVEIILLSRKKQLFIFILDRNVKLFIDYIELLNLMKNKIINYLISSDTKLENRLNYSKPYEIICNAGDKVRGIIISKRINKANNYSRGVVISSYISLIYTLSVKSHYSYVHNYIRITNKENK